LRKSENFRIYAKEIKKQTEMEKLTFKQFAQAEYKSNFIEIKSRNHRSG